MRRVLLLILVLMASAAFAQTDEKPEAKKTDELGIAGYEDISARVDAFIIVELNNNPTAQGYVINYGPEKDISRRESQIKKFSAAFQKLDPRRITFINAGYRETIKTEFWVVPAGAEPKLVPTARILDEFGKLSRAQWEKRLANVGEKFKGLKDVTAQLMIVNYGTNKEIAAAESFIREYFGRCCDRFGDARITIVRGGFEKKPRRVFWVIPQSTELPTPKKVETSERDETPKPVKLEEFGELTNGYIKIKIHRFFKELKNNPTSKGYIINYGTAKEIAKRNAQIRDAIGFFKYDSSKVTLVRGGVRKVIKTQFWIVPAGVEFPIPEDE